MNNTNAHSQMLGLQSGLLRQPPRQSLVPRCGPRSGPPRLPLRKRNPVWRTQWSRRGLSIRKRAVGLELFVGYVSPAREVFSMSLDTFIGGFAALSLAFGILPLLSPNAKTVKKETDELDDIKWSVATVVSFLPYFNWTSWLLVAFDSENPFVFYFLSLLYLIPSIESGFQLDAFSVFMIALGVAHIQVERIAQTEPDFFELSKTDGTLNPLGALSSLVNAISESFKKQSTGKVEFKKSLPNGSRKSTISELVDKELTKTRKELEDAKELAKLEKQYWDNEFDNRTE